eukprot:COSAG01_NODE_1252_length_11052_cov_503.195380_9_plen_56_part_00
MEPLGQVATLIVPADVAWGRPSSELHRLEPPQPPPFPVQLRRVSDSAVDHTCHLL